MECSYLLPVEVALANKDTEIKMCLLNGLLRK